MHRCLLLFTIGCALLIPIESHASEWRLFNTSLTAPQPRRLPGRINSGAGGDVEKPSLGLGWMALQLIPSLYFDTNIVIFQTRIATGEKALSSHGRVFASWTLMALSVALVSSGWMYLVSRIAGVKPSWLTMAESSMVFRFAGVLLAGVALLVTDHPPAWAIVPPLALGALAGTISELRLGAKDIASSSAPPAARPPDSANDRAIDTRALLQLPIVAMRF